MWKNRLTKVCRISAAFTKMVRRICKLHMKNFHFFWCRGTMIRPWLCYCSVEMGRSSVNAEVRPNNSAECSARFGSATCDYSAELRQKFGVTCGFAFTVFCSPAGVNLNPLLIISYQLVTNFPVGIQLLDDDDVQ